MISTLFDTMGIALYLLQGYFCYKAFGALLEPRKPIFCKIIAYIIVSVVCCMVIFPNDVFNITVNIPILVLFLAVGYKGRLIVKLSLGLLVFPIIIGMNFLVNDIGNFLYETFTDRREIVNTVMANTSICITVIFWFVVMKLLQKQSESIIHILDMKSWLLLDIIGLASMAAVISSVYFTPPETYKVWICMAACVVANIGSIRLVFYVADSIKSDMERKNLKLQKDYYEELEQNQTEIRSFRHDMNNHFTVVASLLEKDSTEEARMYFKKLATQMESKGRVFCRNSVVNAVINSKYNKAMGEAIDCFFHIEIDQLLFVEGMDICTIFANTLDNAIEACQQIENQEKRYISVKARYTENGYFSYEVKNSKENKITEQGGKYRTQKKEEKNHGFGVSNVRGVVENYGGVMEITHSDTEFCVNILLGA